MKPPPCIQTMTGFFAAGVEVLRPDVQILAVLVRHPVAMREHEFVGADRRLLRNRADGPQTCAFLTPVQGWTGLGAPHDATTT